MGIRHRLDKQGAKAIETPTSIVLRAGAPAEFISVCHRDGSISEVRVSADNDDLNIQVSPAMHHPPHLTGGYLFEP